MHPRFLEEVLHRANLSPGRLCALPPARFLINRRVDWLCQLLMQETEKGGPTGRLYFESLAMALLVAVISQTDPRLAEAAKIEEQYRRVKRAIAFVEANFRSKPTLDLMARASYLSAFHFSRLFHRLTGRSPHQYLLDYRLHHAKKLLLVAGRGLSIAEVAAEAGFADQAHFARYFRRAHGMSARAFQQAQEQTKKA